MLTNGKIKWNEFYGKSIDIKRWYTATPVISTQGKSYAINCSGILEIDAQELSSEVQIWGVFVGRSLNFCPALIN